MMENQQSRFMAENWSFTENFPSRSWVSDLFLLYGYLGKKEKEEWLLSSVWATDFENLGLEVEAPENESSGSSQYGWHYKQTRDMLNPFVRFRCTRRGQALQRTRRCHLWKMYVILGIWLSLEMWENSSIMSRNGHGNLFKEMRAEYIQVKY